MRTVRRCGTWLGLILLLVASGQAADRPNILLVLSDDHSAAHVGCYGNREIRTPNLDRFAASGIRFDRAYVACPQCVPSRAAMLSGRSPVSIGMTRFSAPLPAEVKVFPEILRGQGYFAGVAGRTYHMDGSAQPPETKRVFDAHHLQTFRDRLDFVKVAGKGPVILDQFREFLDAVPAGKPFVLQLCFSDPHRPLDADAIAPPHDGSKLTLPRFYPDTPLVRADFARYYDEISRFDADFGTVLQILDDRRLAANTLVLFMGDNGASQFRGKGTLYEFGIKVPLLVRWPSVVQPGSATDQLVSGEDLAATLLSATGVAVPPEMTGPSFLPILRGEPTPGRTEVFSERGAHGSGLPTNSSLFDLGRVVVTRKHKLIYNALWQIPYSPVDFGGDPMWKELTAQHQAGTLAPDLDRRYFAPQRPMFELYDLEADPDELKNLIDEPGSGPIARQLKGKLQEWMILQRDFVPLPLPPGPAARAAAAGS